MQRKPGLPMSRALTWASANVNQLSFLTNDSAGVASGDANVVVPYRRAKG